MIIITFLSGKNFIIDNDITILECINKCNLILFEMKIDNILFCLTNNILFLINIQQYDCEYGLLINYFNTNENENLELSLIIMPINNIIDRKFIINKQYKYNIENIINCNEILNNRILILYLAKVHSVKIAEIFTPRMNNLIRYL